MQELVHRPQLLQKHDLPKPKNYNFDPAIYANYLWTRIPKPQIKKFDKFRYVKTISIRCVPVVDGDESRYSQREQLENLLQYATKKGDMETAEWASYELGKLPDDRLADADFEYREGVYSEASDEGSEDYSTPNPK